MDIRPRRLQLHKEFAMAPTLKTSRVKVREHRQRSRNQGFRPIRIWVPDVQTPAFRAEAHRQSLAVAIGRHARDDQTFIDAISDPGRELEHGEIWSVADGKDYAGKPRPAGITVTV